MTCVALFFMSNKHGTIDLYRLYDIQKSVKGVIKINGNGYDF